MIPRELWKSGLPAFIYSFPESYDENGSWAKGTYMKKNKLKPNIWKL